MKQLFIAGCGYIGQQVAREAQQQGWRVTAQVRDGQKAEALRQQGIAVCQGGLDQLSDVPVLPVAGQVVLYSVPPQGGGSIDLRARTFLAALERDRQTPDRIVYLSATSVYGDTGGAVVTEQSPTEPSSAMGKRRLDAERQFQAFGQQQGIAVVILRVSGIYGPGRLPLMQLNQGQPLLLEALARPSNRIHAADLVQVCLAALEQGDGIYNVSDGAPCSMTAYFNACADALGLPRPPQVDLEEARRVMPPLLLNYFMESRVVANHRMLRELGVSLRYPTLAEGLAASLG